MEPPKGLPTPGSTATTRDAKAPATEALTVEDAAAAYGLSVSTVYRRLHKGEVPGAYKVQTAQGEAWRIPLGSLDAIGYSRVEETPSAPAPAAPGLEAFEGVVKQLTAIIEGHQRQLEAAEADRGRVEREIRDLEVDRATVTAKLEAAEKEAERLRAELEKATQRRGWFRR